MEMIGTVFLIAGVIQLVILIILIVKFLQLASDVKSLKEAIVAPKKDFRKEFYKCIACGDKERAKIVLIDEIGDSSEFIQLLRGGNDNYINDIRKQLKNKYQAELSLIGLNLDLENWN